ncbi:MAG: aspartate aminotransferase family protein [Actinomycetota bacterium]|nr:aspartate aminotransferase family protein [Actinomycetota bacterium]MDK1017695.1 aspartate aminotransferase family protein [Actinomycetota bacterium]MDK1027581.1 aspartate aminotransferase family protein [Actinomycetota bacterium]MDK1039013.1 aspartate aminotransferase family protein [Actinomycetota bacterium]MDK1097571.1 aspartate aminotransferase family protein [Actinomycetota bacterium]
MGIHQELTERTRAVLPSWLALYYDEPIAIDRGEGRTVWDLEGNEYLDFFGGILTTMTAHSLPEVTAAINEQAAKVLHTSTLYLNQPMVELAEMVVEMSGIPDSKVFFTPSGTEANDAAMLLATAYRKSNQVLALRNSYHGRSFTAIALTSHRAWSPTGYSGLNVHYVQGPYKVRSPYRELDDAAFIDAAVEDLRQVIDMMTSGDVACMIVEPIQGVGGFATPPDGFFGAFKEVLDEYGILFVSDEVQTGWGRTGHHLWGYQAHGLTPDILTFAKGIGNGLAIGGVVARREIMDCIGANSISTFGGNPLAAAGALANLRYLVENDLQGNALKTGAQLYEALLPVCDETPWILELRGRGLMLAIETVKPGTLEPDEDRAGRLLEECKNRGLLVGKGGLYGNVVRIAPPMTVTEIEIETASQIIAESVSVID